MNIFCAIRCATGAVGEPADGVERDGFRLAWLVADVVRHWRDGVGDSRWLGGVAHAARRQTGEPVRGRRL